MLFRLTPMSMTLDDLDLLKKPNTLGISRDFTDLGANNGRLIERRQTRIVRVVL